MFKPIAWFLNKREKTKRDLRVRGTEYGGMKINRGKFSEDKVVSKKKLDSEKK